MSASVRTARGLLLLAISILLVVPDAPAGEDEQLATEARIRELGEAISVQRASIEEHARRLEEQSRLLDQQRRVLERQQQELESLLSQIRGGASDPAAELPPVSQAPEEQTAPSPPTPPRPPRPPTPLPPSPRAPEEAEPAQEAQEAERAEQPPAPLPPSPRAPEAAEPTREAQPAQGPQQAEKPAEPSQEGAPAPEAERPKSQKPLEQLLVEVGGILLPAGALQVEPGFEYAHISDSAVAIAGLTIFRAILIGTISVDRLDRDLFQAPLTLRYGLFNRFQLEAKVPLAYRRDAEIIGVGTPDQFEREIDNWGIGDIEFGSSYQALIGRGWKPNLIVRLGAIAPTGEDAFEIPQVEFETGEGEEGETLVRLKRPPLGSGFWGLSPSFTALWRSDPAVLFFGAGYTVNFERDVGKGFGEIDPGDQVDCFLGMNVSFSERIAFNLSFVDTQVFHTKQNGRTSPGTAFNDGRIVLGASIGMSQRSTMILATAIGLTDQSPDFQFTLRLPFTWSLAPLFGRPSFD